MKNKILIVIICVLGLALVLETLYLVSQSMPAGLNLKKSSSCCGSRASMSKRPFYNPAMPPIGIGQRTYTGSAAMTKNVDPFEQMDMMQRNMNKMMAEMSRGAFMLNPNFAMQSNVSIGINVYFSETPEEYVIRADVPGMEKKDINIEISGNVLTISGERKTQEEVTGKDYQSTQSMFGVFSKSVILPQEVKKNQIKAEYKNGVLMVRIPKLKPQKNNTKTKIAVM